MSENIPHSLGGFRGAFESEHGRKPTEQEIWNAAIRSWRDITRQKSDSAKELEEVIADLLMYAGDNGYRHIDYADTMRHAAALLQSAALPVGELPEPFHPRASHINPDYRDGWNAALAAARSQPTTEESLVVAGAKPVREPLTPDTHYQEWKHGCDSMCTNITLWIDRCPHCGKPRPVVEAARLQPVREPLTDYSDTATIAGLESSVGHLSVMVDELRLMLGDAMNAMTELHSKVTPDEDTPNIDGIVPAAAYAKFVNAHADLLYRIHHSPHAGQLSRLPAAHGITKKGGES